MYSHIVMVFKSGTLVEGYHTPTLGKFGRVKIPSNCMKIIDNKLCLYYFHPTV